MKKRMVMRKTIVLILFISAFHFVNAQGPVTDLYQYNYTTVNPAFAGLNGEKITASPLMQFTHGSVRGSNAYAGYETRIGNNGLGVSAVTSNLGPQSESYLSAFYNYQLKVDDKSKFVFTGKVSDYMSSIDFSKYKPIDPNDPILAGGWESSHDLMLGLGILYKRDHFFAGLFADNLVTTGNKSKALIPYPSGKVIHYTVGVDYKIAKWLEASHSVYAQTVPSTWRVDLNNSFTIANWVIAGVSFEEDSAYKKILPKVNAGIKLKDKGQILVGLYSKHFPDYDYKVAQVMLVFNLK